MTDEHCVSPETVKFYLGEDKAGRKDDGLGEFGAMPLGEAKEAFEKLYLESKLAACGFNITKTAEAIGIYPSNLHGKIKRYGIKIEK